MAAIIGGDLQRAARIAGDGRRLWGAESKELSRLLRTEQERIDEVVAVRAAFDCAAEYARLEMQGIGHVGLGAGDYPVGLDEIPDPPFGLFLSGREKLGLLCASAPVVAIVGSRRPTAFGLQFARRLARRLGECGAVVVSGLALGIDAAAHEGALAAGASTVAVVGCGVDVAYPKRNDELRDEILKSGVVVSEYWPGTAPAPWRFPARNRIVAGLADAVVVVEAGERSGALITADFAMEQGRPVLAVPGSPGAAMAAGCNALLRAGAGMCESVQDVIDELPHLSWTESAAEVPAPVEGLDGAIYTLLQHAPLPADGISLQLGVEAAAVAAALARLELSGHVLRGQAQRYWAAPLRGAA